MYAVDKFHKTRLGYLAFGLVELVLGLAFVNLAIPSGDWWEWVAAFFGLFGSLQNFGRMIVGTRK
jgi:hypothetical protein